jgi:hypothetical protein
MYVKIIQIMPAPEYCSFEGNTIRVVGLGDDSSLYGWHFDKWVPMAEIAQI